jgi:AmmeMemoRadiSam system protein B
MKTITDVRPSPIAGRWYPGNPRELAASVDAYITQARLPPIEGEVVGVMAPHAGHLYSGPVAGYAFSALRGLNPEVVAVVSPMHYPYAYLLLTSAHAAYQTPLGVIPIDRELIQALNVILTAQLGYGLREVANDPEHSLEIELPFLQRALAGEFRLLPIMVADPSRQVTRALGEALAQVLKDQKAILVASTDLSHFYPQPLANQLDAEMLRQVEAFNPEGVLEAEEEGKGFACGRAALATVLWAAKGLGADRVQVVHHATSGDVTGDYSQVVGYGAAVITRHG